MRLPRFARNDGKGVDSRLRPPIRVEGRRVGQAWIPAFAGMTILMIIDYFSVSSAATITNYHLTNLLP